MSHENYIRAAAIHEAAHAIAAFHWNVPIGDRGVSLTVMPSGDHAAGFSDVRWVDLQPYSAHADCVGTLIGPFAEYRFWLNHSAGFDNELFYLGCDADFGHIYNAGYVTVTPTDMHSLALNGFNDAQRLASLCGERLLRLWLDREQQPGTDGMALDLVRDTDAVLGAYQTDIESFAEMLLDAADYRLSRTLVIAWRKEHFQKRVAALSARAT